jgi:hypothetical protein
LGTSKAATPPLYGNGRCSANEGLGLIVERYSAIYLIGTLNRAREEEGQHPIAMQILVGEGGNQWLEPHYFDRSLRPLGDVELMISSGPGSANALIDACIVFLPEYFVRCPALQTMQLALAGVTCLDFSCRDSIPRAWEDLREQARPYFALLDIRRAVLQPLPVWQMDTVQYFASD